MSEKKNITQLPEASYYQDYQGNGRVNAIGEELPTLEDVVRKLNEVIERLNELENT